MEKGNPKYSKIYIFYFSGTGNAKNASVWISQAAHQMSVASELINIEKNPKFEIPDTNEKILIGICSPTHGFNVPPIVIKFIFSTAQS